MRCEKLNLLLTSRERSPCVWPISHTCPLTRARLSFCVLFDTAERTLNTGQSSLVIKKQEKHEEAILQ